MMDKTKPEKQNHDPNLVSKRFLADLVGKRVTIRISEEWSLTGTLRRFDNYCLIVSIPDQEDVMVLKGPGVVIAQVKELAVPPITEYLRK